MTDLRDFQPGEVLEVKVFVMVAKRGDVDDWAVYSMTTDELGHAFHQPASFIDPTTEAVTSYVCSQGNKVPQEAAKFHFFTNIGGGAYRD